MHQQHQDEGTKATCRERRACIQLRHRPQTYKHSKIYDGLYVAGKTRSSFVLTWSRVYRKKCWRSTDGKPPCVDSL